MARKFKDENGKTYVEKKPFYKKWWFWLIVIILVIGAVGASGGSNEPTPKESSTSTQSTSKQSSSEKDENKVFKVGQAIDYDGIELKADEVKFIKPGEYDRLGDNEEFVAVKVTIKNVNHGDSVDYNSLDFTLNTDGNKTNMTEYLINNDSITKNMLESGSLDKGAETSGWLIGKAKTTAKKLQLNYTGNLFEKESKVTINLK